ncbi:peroxiredoxin [Cellulomonas sp. PhB143]|uniref:peroxiredoxin n=1 Tax=Cellulomonas sp. PhB143 TaxID=2485186 RepID=UPI000F4634C9|nr:peroxiredoxin [Cellulomonas sp. PhB143]ROS78946.1 peroxiredoxin Q/BCP [Cellulomonas sp. PhB143]
MSDDAIENTTARLVAGDPAPDLRLRDQDGAPVALADYRGRGVVVYFYPKAATPGCTTEACDFRDSLASLQGAGYAVVGVSPDAPEALTAFSGEHGLGFPLLSDLDGAVARAWGAWGDGGLLRSTVVIDPTGDVRLAQYGVAAQGHVARLRQELTSAS